MKEEEMIQVSFVVAIYNVGKYLSRCIESLIEQTRKDIEIILVNDGSSDDSLELCNSYAARDDRITVIDQKNQGANAARNHGLHVAKGEWIYFVDGDDSVDREICARLAAYMDQEYDVILFSNAVCAGDRIKVVKHSEQSILLEREDFAELQLSALNRLGKYRYEMNRIEPACIWNKIYRKSFLREYHIEFVPNFPKLQDISFNLLVYDKAQKGIYVPIVGYYYRINQESVTRRYQNNIINKFEIVNRWFAAFVSEKTDARFEKAYKERVATHIRTCIVLYLCNSSNPEKYCVRKKKFMQLCMREPYKSAVESTSMSDYRGYKEKILSLAVKKRQFWICEILCKMNDLRMKIAKEA